MKLRDRIWCWSNQVCRKHLTRKLQRILGGWWCPVCEDEERRLDERKFDERLERLRKEQTT